MITSHCKRFAWRKLIMIGLLLGLSVPAAAIAAQERGESLIGSTITVGSELDYPPYADVDEEGNADGFSVDLIKAAAKQVGLKLKFVVGPWSEVKAKLERGEIDALPLVAYSVEREKYFDFSHPHIISHAVVFVRKGQTKIKSIEDLHDKEVIVMESDSTHEYILFSHITDKIILTKTVGESFELLASGKHDFVIAPKLSGLLLLQELGIDNIEPFGDPLETYGKGYSFAVHEGNSELLALLNRGLVLVKASGEYNRIYDKWFGHVDPSHGDNSGLIRNIAVSSLLVVLIIMLGFVWNLTLRKRVREKTAELKASETRFSATFAEAAIGLAHVAPDGSWLRVNQALCNIVGYSEEELLQSTFQDITHPDDLDADLHFVEQLLAGEIEHYSMEKRYIRKGGSTVWINLTVSLVRKGNAEPDYFISAVEDISARKVLEIEVQKARKETDQFFELVPDFVCVASTDGYFIKLNDTWEEVLGYSREELCSKPFTEFIHPDDVEKTNEARSEIRDGQAISHFSNRYRCKDGSYRWLEWVSTEAMEGLFYAAGRDITERREMDLLLTKERDQAQQYLDVVSVMMVALDRNGTISLINNRGLEILGYQEEEMLGKDWFETCLPKDALAEVRKVFCRIMDGDLETVEYYENPVITKSGESRIIAFHNALLKNPKGQITGLISSGEDITERKLAADNLKKMSRAIEQAGEAVVITDADAIVEYLNPAFERITGYSREEMIGQNPRLLQSGKHDKAFYEKMWERLTSGKVWQGRLIDKRKDGSLYPAMVTISPLKNDAGEITHYVGVQQSLKKYEDLETQFHQAQKMEAIGTLVGGIAHDFNNSLAGITSNLYLARQKTADIDVKGRLENAEKLAFSAAGTIQQLLAFSRKGVVNMSTISIAPFLKEIIKLHRVSIPENIVLTHDITDTGLKIHGDINQLQQAVMNLMNNARDAVEHTELPAISVNLSYEHISDAEIIQSVRVRPGEYVCISVTDNGCGISAENMDHIFEPFFTTKEAGKGTGLGLAMTYGVVKTHGGWIFSVPAEQGTGTTMKVFLPLVDVEESQLAEFPTDTIIDGQGETILLVDDNQMVLEVGKEVLEGLNYQVLTANDGLHAVEVFTAQQERIDLLLLDVVMPRLGGMEALKQIRQINPDVKAMFLTGYNKANAVSTSDAFKHEKILSKPFAIPELSQEIRNKLKQD